jgi:putative oxygen-independent coproporphyrinogen III oxidase
LNLPDIPLSLYIHLPWCEKKCPYCDFNISTNKSDTDEENLIKAIIFDIENSKVAINNRKFKSIYFGGGTPSLVKGELIGLIINFLKKNDLIENNAEVSFEFNPQEVSKDYLDCIVGHGVNRLSIGVQSFDDGTLSSLERNHNKKRSLESIEVISLLKGVRTSIDLIYGVMDQTLNSFEVDLKTFSEFDLSHLSLYQLTIEPNTIFYKRELRTPSEEVIEDMERSAKKILNSNGYFQYEVSSWSLDNQKGIHNMNYWSYGDYLGVGPGAHSKITLSNGVYRSIKMKKVLSYIQNPLKNNGKYVPKKEIDLDLAMNFLRIKDGVSLEELKNNTYLASDNFFNKIEIAIKKGLIEKDRFKATDQGYKFLNDTINIFG